MPDGVIIFAHGSRIESANEAVRAVAEAFAKSTDALVTAAFLELGQPNLETAASLLVDRGAGRLVIVPYFLTLGLHMERDLPPLVDRIRLQNNGLEVRIAPPLDGHPALLEIIRDRVRSAFS